jgi:hypothetical protein
MNPRPDLKLVNSHKPTAPSTGLEPYLALERRPRSKSDAKRRDWGIYLSLVAAGAAYLAICWGMGWLP